MPTSVLLSVKPQFAEAILDGSKKYEFRRALFRSPTVERVVLYASSPIQKVVGEFRLAEVLSMRPTALWSATSSGAGIGRSYFNRYFAGRKEGHALRVAEPRRYAKPRDLTRDYGIGRPPQSFCYLVD